MQSGIDRLWRFTGELFAGDAVDAAMVERRIGVDPATLATAWDGRINAVLSEARLGRPDDPYQRMGGRSGFHSEHLGHLLGELQWMQRTYPGLEW
jgi:ring-1,2-phenylacetyl-CoA epoxidase subunit PaaC